MLVRGQQTLSLPPAHVFLRCSVGIELARGAANRIGHSLKVAGRTGAAPVLPSWWLSS